MAKHQQCVGPGGHPPDRPFKPGAEVEQDEIVAVGFLAQVCQRAFQGCRIDRRQCAGPGAAGDDGKSPLVVVDGRFGEGDMAGDNGAQIMLRGQAKLDVHVGETQVGVE